MTMIEQFKAARRVSVPLMVVRTVDQIATVEAIRSATEKDVPVVQWDAVRGLTGVNEAGTSKLKEAKIKSEDTIGFVEAMAAALLLPRLSVVCAHNAHKQLMSAEPMASAAAAQAVSNLREPMKKSFRMLVLMGPVFVLPTELEQDVIVVEHELPGPGELAVIVRELYESAYKGERKPSDETVAKATDALSGLSSFSAEQQTATSLTPEGVDLAALWERKRVAIEQTRGLRVHRGGERFADIVGLDSLKQHLRDRIGAKMPIGVVLFLDEIDKVFSNVEHDTSGVRMDQFRTFLTTMEDYEWDGALLVGVPGGGKSLVAKAFGNEAGVPTIALDLGDMEAPHVGESEALLRLAMSVIKRVGNGRAYVLATSNNMSVMRPELQRRFTDGMFFFDLMTEAERAACWAFYLQKYGLDAAQEMPDDEGWTGAEVRNCCRSAWNKGISLVAASRYIVPMARSRSREIDYLRGSAHQKMLDATKPGFYEYSPVQFLKENSEVAKEVLRGIDLPTTKDKVN